MPQKGRNVPPVAGLGVSRADVQAAYEQPQFGLTFKPAPPIRGVERVLGETDDRMAAVELIGPAENLTKATIVITNRTHDDLVTALGLAVLDDPIQEAQSRRPVILGMRRYE